VERESNQLKFLSGLLRGKSPKSPLSSQILTRRSVLAMLRFPIPIPGRVAMAALRHRSTAPVFASRAATPRGNPLPFRSALALTPAVPARWLGGRARSAVGADALVPTAVGLGAGGCRGGVSRGLAGSRGGSTGGGGPDGRLGGGGHGSAHSREIHPGKLTNLIKQCGDAGRLQGLVEEHGGSFDHIHVSAAWVTLKMRSVGERGALLQQLQDVTWQTVQAMGAREVANVVHSMATLHGSGRMVLDDELA
jgi:hypothetical protein